MKKIIAILLSVSLMAVCFSGCGKTASADGDTVIGDTVNFMCWGSCYSEEVFKDFEEKTGCHVNVSYITNTDELLAKMTAGNHGLDLIQLEHAYVKTFVEADILQEFNPDNVPNLKLVHESCFNPIGDEDNKYTMPDGADPVYSVLIYNTETCPVEITSFKDLAKPELKGMVTLPESTVTLFGTALAALGYDPSSENEEEYEEAYELLMTIKPNLKALTGATGVDKLENGDAAAGIYFGNDWLNLNSKPENRGKFEIAEIEGCEKPPLFFSVTKEAEHKAAAEALANFLLEPEEAAKCINEFKRKPCEDIDLLDEFLTDEVKSNPALIEGFPDYITEKAWLQTVSPESVALMDKYYTLFKS